MLLEALGGDETVVFAAAAASVQVQVEPVGRWFEAYVKRRNRSTSTSFQELEEEEESEEELEDEEFQLEEYPMLRTLDPKDWKNQDHYAVLGLINLRYRATQKQIKAAHKAIVLKHHPDKRKAAGEQIVEGDNDYFTCITKAIEILSDPVKRRAFDSVDPTFDNAVPSKGEGKENFYEVFAPVFERNARWSSKKHVPKLGTMESSFEEVDNFYSFWYNFDSWREFSYLDEEEKEKAECRDERRWIEKQNRASRAQRKKEEMNRIRTLVDTAYSCDPRIKKFKEEEKARKESEKKAKADAKKREQEEKERVSLILKLILTKLKVFFISFRWEVIANYMNLHSTSGMKRNAKDVINKAKNLQRLDPLQKDEINRKAFEKFKKEHSSVAPSIDNAMPSERFDASGSDGNAAAWTTEEQKLLEQALKTYPVSTPERWEKIAAAVPGRSKKDCMKRYKELVEMVKAKKAAQEQVAGKSKK
ncbi:dnaJ homolog subfamily C member 2 [Morone saxatilis]|uniref:dnaJ homolog subfamily C member 2 n=1 Tax=Morone saxatilis TaxID=34816 RepID=UPI0015E23660|nr:dnaJ homolog subfamily C member 2 [Morone saxatilis]